MESDYYDKVDPEEIIRKLDELIIIVRQRKEAKNEEKLRYPHKA